MLLHDVSKAFLTNEMLAFNAQLQLQAINKSEQQMCVHLFPQRQEIGGFILS